jgi:hypothetical protein
MKRPEEMTKPELQRYLRMLERKSNAHPFGNPRMATILMLKSGMATASAALVMLVITVAATFAFLNKGAGFIDGTHLVLIAFILVGGLIIYFSFVFGRAAKVRAEISKTKKLIEMSSGDRV